MEQNSALMDMETPDRKRKQDGGSTGVSPDLKKHYAEVGDLSEPLVPIPEVDPSTREMIMNCVADCFNDEAFIKKITPTIVTLTQEVSKIAINDAVTKAVIKLEKDVIKPLQIKTDILTRAIEEKNKTIKDKDAIIMAKDELLNKKADDIVSLEYRVNILENKLDDLEQYGRRASVRMFNVPQLPGQSCTGAALHIINDVLEVPMGEDDIERCHYLGKANAKGFRPLIVKFKSYKSKAAVFTAKKKLKNNPGKIFISEDLTKKNHEIVQKLVQLRKDTSIDSFWTNDGKINVKVYEMSLPARVGSISDVDQLLPKLTD